MANVTGRSTVQCNFTQTPSTGILINQSLSIPENLNMVLGASGTAADSCDLIHAKTYTFVASTGQTIDLTSLLDPFGAAVNFARVRIVAVKVKSQTNAASLTLGNAASNAWAAIWGATGTHIVPASSSLNDAFMILTAPNTTGFVTSGSSKSLLMLPSAHAFDADLILVGCSA